MTDYTKSPVPLNLPKDKKLQFNEVSFVNGMSEYSLKVLVKRIWQQLLSLANVMEGRRSDVTSVLDRITSGTKWTAKDIQDRYQYGLHDNFTIQYDTLNRVFVLLDKDTREPLTNPIKAVSVSEGKAHAKEQRKLRNG